MFRDAPVYAHIPVTIRLIEKGKCEVIGVDDNRQTIPLTEVKTKYQQVDGNRFQEPGAFLVRILEGGRVAVLPLDQSGNIPKPPKPYTTNSRGIRHLAEIAPSLTALHAQLGGGEGISNSPTSTTGTSSASQ